MDNFKTQQVETLQTAYDYMIKLINVSKNVAEQLKAEEVGQAYEVVIQIFDGCTWLIDALMLTNDLHDKPLEMNNLKVLLNTFINALENQDNVLLADLFEYELIEQLEIWHLLIKQTLEQLETVQ